MSSLVADYGTSSENDSDCDSSDSTNNKVSASQSNKTCNLLMGEELDGSSSDGDDDNDEDSKIKDTSPVGNKLLPNPLAPTHLGVTTQRLPPASKTTITHSVFKNQYTKAEEAKHSILEQHVKMTAKTQAKSSDSRKVCWNFRKGQCRKGHKCPFAHGNDIPLAKTATAEDNNEDAATKTDYYGNQSFRQSDEADQDNADDDGFVTEAKMKKRRVGMAAGLVPPKKAMHALNEERAKERPWTVNR